MHLADRTYMPSPLNMDYVVADRLAGTMVHAKPRRDKVAIYANGLGRGEAPLEDPAWEVWALNTIAPVDAQGRLRVDRWFELHEMHAQSDDDLRWIAACPCPIYLVPQAFETRREPPYVSLGESRGVLAVPQAVRYPLEQIETHFGRGYWPCSFCYQIALATWSGYTDIGLYGVELAWGTERERTVEWAGTAWWCGVAEGRGIRIHTPRTTTLGRHWARYGIEYEAEAAAVYRYVNTFEREDQIRALLRAEGRLAEANTGMGG